MFFHPTLPVTERTFACSSDRHHQHVGIRIIGCRRVLVVGSAVPPHPDKREHRVGDGGSRGIYLYDGAATTYIRDNKFPGVGRPLHTKSAKNTFFGDNKVPSYDFKITPGDTVIFGKNSVDREKFSIPSRARIESGELAE